MTQAHDESPARRSHPSKLFVEVTTRCNLGCAMCVKQTKHHGMTEGLMSEDIYFFLAPAFPHLGSPPYILKALATLFLREIEGFFVSTRGNVMV